MFCIYCGSQVDSSATRCSCCGKLLPKLPDIETTQSASQENQSNPVLDRLKAVPELDPVKNTPEEGSSSGSTGVASGTSESSLDEDPIDPFADVDVEQELGPYIQDIPDVFKRDRQGNIINPYNVQAEDLLPSWSNVGRNISVQDTAEFPRVTTLDNQADPILQDEPKVYSLDNSVPQKMTGLQKLLLVVLILVIAGLSYLTYLLGTHQLELPNNWLQQVVPLEEPAKQTEQTPVIDAPQKQVDSSPEAILEDLNRNYVDIGSMNERIAGIVDDFNSWFQISNAEKRGFYAKKCSDLLAEITQAKDEFNKGMQERGVVFGSPYYEQVQALDALYDNLQQRMQVLNDAWTRSATSENPVADSSYILEPIAQANSSGASSLVNDFAREYPAAKPHAVESEQ